MGRPSRKRRASPEQPYEQPVRRSARLLEKREKKREDSRPTRPKEHSRNPNDIRSCTMEIAVAPPSRVAVNQALRYPIVVVFHGPDRSASEEIKDQGASRTRKGYVPLRDLSGIWAYLSLVSEDGKESLSPPRTDLLKGRKADSIHPGLEEAVDGEDVFAYVTFSSLSISEPGRYCFKVNVIDMNQSPPQEDSETGGRILPPIYSEVFEVLEGREHSSDQLKLVKTIDHLKRVGLEMTT